MLKRNQSFVWPSVNVSTWWEERSFKFNASKLWLHLPSEIIEFASFKILLSRVSSGIIPAVISDVIL
jgi:hypothetical protein